jgi:CDP-glucose 4,6-dehydratase
MNAGFWRDRRVFVTGASGIVGSWLVRNLLDAGAYCVVLVRDADPQSELLRSGDIRRTVVVNGQLEDFATLERAINEHEIDTVFHLAAQAIVGAANRSPLQTFESNIRGTYNLLEACRRLGQSVSRVVIASSDKAYGEADLPYTEATPLQGRFPYEVSKSCADLIAQSYFHTYGLPVGITRCGNIYGGGDLNWSRIVPGTIRSLLRGERPVIRSDGQFVRDYIYVGDVVRAYMLLAEKMEQAAVAGSAFNVSPERPVTVMELVDSLRRIMGCEHIQPDIRNTASGEIHSQYLDSSRARSVLGWEPRYSLETGLAETVAWYRAYLESAPV